MDPSMVSAEARAAVDGAIVTTVLPECYDIINQLMEAKPAVSKALIVQARRILPLQYSQSFGAEKRKQ